MTSSISMFFKRFKKEIIHCIPSYRLKLLSLFLLVHAIKSHRNFIYSLLHKSLMHMYILHLKCAHLQLSSDLLFAINNHYLNTVIMDKLS